MLTYEKLIRQPRTFRSMMGLDIAEFDRLYGEFEYSRTETEAERTGPDERRITLATYEGLDGDWGMLQRYLDAELAHEYLIAQIALSPEAVACKEAQELMLRSALRLGRSVALM